MRTLEWLMVVMSLPAIAWILFGRGKTSPKWPVWCRISAIISLLLLPLHAWLEGPHWQMGSIYLAILLLLYPLLRPGMTTRTRLWLGSIELVLIAGGLAVCFTVPMFHLPKTTGPYPIATRTLHLVDPNRQETHPHARPGQREIVVQIFYPSATTAGPHAVYRQLRETDLRSTYQAVLKTQALQDAPVATGRFPVILFNHAWRGFRNRSSYILQELASQGFIVVGISHPYNAAVTALKDEYLADGRKQIDLGDFYSKPPMTLEQRLTLAHNEMRIQTDDDRFLLDQLAILDKTPGDPLAGHFDLGHVGAFGHSFGGSVSAELANEDSRVNAVIILDGVLHGPVAETGLPKPLFRIQAETPEMAPGSEYSPIQSTRVHAQMSKLGETALASSFQRFGGYQVVLRGIDHENFSDKGFFSPFHSLSGIGYLPQSRAAMIINTYIVAFFLQTLKNEPQAVLSNEPQPFPEVVRFQSWPVQKAPTSDPARQ